MKIALYVASPSLVSALFWLAFVACVDAPVPDTPPAARVVTTWDPLVCGEPHRVVLELEASNGEMLSGSTPCSLGVLALDVPHLGIYRGQIYAWFLNQQAEIRSVMSVELAVDEPVVRWIVQTPK